MPTKHKPKRKFSNRSLVTIGAIILAMSCIAGWRINSKASADDWQFYVSVHYGNPSQGEPETKTMNVDGQKTNGTWTVFRLTSVCDFSGPAADMQQFLNGMSEQPEVRRIERTTPNVIMVDLREPLSGPALTDFSNFMMQGVAATGLNNCGGKA